MSNGTGPDRKTPGEASGALQHATIVAGEETHEIESGAPDQPGSPPEPRRGTLVAGEETHEIEGEGGKTPAAEQSGKPEN
ncbi:hypothetical protein [Amaricoccus solimangrovi]|uniref:Uncharacterized protein n=1 Tax=Amaricoccus solimangrovi TaxID=2589815 RepID=A0A501WQA9_9RHOB|nr:hypothetical protein [Amaricoccus solimangrovi]TPE51042.1 hypothetical protein FJM51_10440 [Amaricoccus solimangrovi]